MARTNPPQLERKMLAGCTGYVGLSLGGFMLGIWPFFLWTRHWLVAELALCFGLGFLPSMILGVLGTRRYGIPGASGFFASGLALGIFLYLRLWQMFMAFEAERSVEPEYPRAFLWMLPGGYVLLVAFLATFALAWPRTGDGLD